jgi:membrane protease YdiL (CAAX protease family)
MRPERSTPLAPFHPAAAIAITALGILAMRLGAQLAGDLHLGIRGTLAAGTLLLGAPALLALLLHVPARRATLGETPQPAGRTAGLCLVLGLGLWITSVGVITLQALVRPPTEDELALFRQIHAALAPANALDAVVSVGVIALLPAACEELLMRGVLLTSLAGWLGRTPAIFLTAAAFAVIHDPLRLLFALVLGVAFGYVRVWTASLWPSMLVHATLNTLTFVVAPLVDDPSKPYTPEPLLGLGALAVGVALSWPLLRALRLRAPGA